MGPVNQTRPVGSVAIMPCIANGGGFPIPVITWYKESHPVEFNQRIFTDDAGTLRINGKIFIIQLFRQCLLLDYRITVRIYF